MAHLVDDTKGAKGAGAPGKTTSPSGTGGAGGDRGAIKANLTCAIDIISSCFNNEAPKMVQKIGLFKL